VLSLVVMAPEPPSLSREPGLVEKEWKVVVLLVEARVSRQVEVSAVWKQVGASRKVEQLAVSRQLAPSPVSAPIARLSPVPLSLQAPRAQSLNKRNRVKTQSNGTDLHHPPSAPLVQILVVLNPAPFAIPAFPSSLSHNAGFPFLNVTTTLSCSNFRLQSLGTTPPARNTDKA